MLGKSVGLIVLCACSPLAMAAGVVFTDRAAFEAAMGAHRTYSFDTADGFPSAPAAIQTFDGPFPQFSSFDLSASIDSYGAGGNQALTGRANNQLSREAPLRIIPGFDTTAIGFDILDLGGSLGERAAVVISDGGDPPGQHFFHVEDNDANPATPVFFGLIFTPEITGFSVYAENFLCAGPGICFTPNLIDNLTLVPEPSGLLMLLVGGTALIVRRRNITARD